MKKLTPRQYATILYSLTEGKKGGHLETAITVFADFLKKRHVFSLFPYIQEAFRAYTKEKSGILPGTFTTARPLSARESHEIQSRMGKHAELTAEVDPRLIGGIRLRIGDRIVDGSIQSAITQLTHHLA